MSNAAESWPVVSRVDRSRALWPVHRRARDRCIRPLDESGGLAIPDGRLLSIRSNASVCPGTSSTSSTVPTGRSIPDIRRISTDASPSTTPARGRSTHARERPSRSSTSSDSTRDRRRCPESTRSNSIRDAERSASSVSRSYGRRSSARRFDVRRQSSAAVGWTHCSSMNAYSTSRSPSVSTRSSSAASRNARPSMASGSATKASLAFLIPT